MSQCHSSELADIVSSLQDVAQRIHPGCEDDLEALLTWLNPNESESNHHMRPPPLRLKDTIKLFVNQYYNSGFSSGPDEEIIKAPEFELGCLLRQFYIHQVRVHFFTSFGLIKTFKDVQRLEKYYESPLAYIYLFESNPLEWVIERDGLRHYLLNRNAVFRENMKQRMESLVIQDEFEYLAEMLDWVDKAHTGLSSKSMLIDLILSKVTRFCEDHMTGIYGKSYLVMKTFNKFITNYWSNFAQLLGCPEDDHELTNILYTCFEKQFIRIRTQEVFDIFVHEFPTSKPTIIEMKRLITHSADFKRLVIVFLSAFQEKVLNLSVTTVDALLAYVRSVKAFLTLDPTGRYLQSVISFVKQMFQERSDLVIILLYAILDLQLDKLVEGSRIQVDPDCLKSLASELRDPELGIEDEIYANKNLSKSEGEIEYLYDKGRLPYEEIMRQFLSWNPDPSDMLPQTVGKHTSSHMSLLDILLELFESKDFFVSEFLKLLTKRLLSLKYYSLDRNWSKCLQLLKKKLSGGVSSSLLATNQHNGGVRGEDYSSINSNDVMLRDVKLSCEMCQQMHQVSGLDKRIYPKFISYLYWNCQLESKNDFIIPEDLNREFERYCRVYSELKAGRALKLLKDDGVVELELEFQDGRAIKFDVTLEQYSVIQQFDETRQINRLMAEVISSNLNMDCSRTKKTLQFWVDNGVLYQDGKFYVVQETIQDSKNPEKAKADSAGSTYENNEATVEEEGTLSATLKSIWPFLQGMLTNLGSLKSAKIHSFLKVALPKEIGYTMVTQSQLEAYLNTLVEEEKLACTTNGSYKLA